MRSQRTIQINSELKIVRLKGNIKFLDVDGYYMPKGYCFKHPKMGFVSFDGVMPYMPQGGKNALKSILEQGGFLDYDTITFLTVQ